MVREEIKEINKAQQESEGIVINLEGENITYQVTMSDEKYKVNAPTKSRKNNGSCHNQKKENETKRINGKIGEQIVMEYEKRQI